MNDMHEVKPQDVILRLYPTNNHALTRDGEIIAGGLWTLELAADNPELSLEELERISRFLSRFVARERAAARARREAGAGTGPE